MSASGELRQAARVGRAEGESMMGIYAGLGASALLALLFGRADRRGKRRC